MSDLKILVNLTLVEVQPRKRKYNLKNKENIVEKHNKISFSNYI
jgi:hypothetical protein